MKENSKVRNTARVANVPQWKIAEYLGISEPTITRWLRTPLSADKEKAVMEAIEAIAKEG